MKKASEIMLRSNESGIAMIITIGALMVASLLALHMMVSSRGTSYESGVMAEYSRLKYVAESEAERAFMVFHQEQMLRTTNPPPPASPISTIELDIPYQTSDGVWVVFNDFANGLAILPRDILDGRVFGEELAPKDIELLNDLLADYIDVDDIPRFRGMERVEYTNQGLSGLPRNAPFEFREELLWIPAVRDILQEYCNPGQSVFELFQKIPLQGCPPLRESPTGKKLVATTPFHWPSNDKMSSTGAESVPAENLEDRKFSGIVTINVYVEGNMGIRRSITISRHHRQISGPAINNRPYLINWEHRSD